MSPDEIVKRFESVDAVKLKAFGARLMETESPSLAVLGPTSGLESLTGIAARFGG